MLGQAAYIPIYKTDLYLEINVWDPSVQFWDMYVP
jgi:hypothetical protein